MSAFRRSCAMILVVCASLSGAWAQTAPLTETFDQAVNGLPDCLLSTIGTLPSGWTDGGGSAAWTMWSGATPSAWTGPLGGAEASAGYAYCETSATCATGEFLLVSPAVDVSPLAAPTLTFSVHLFGPDIGTLEVQQQTSSGWATKIRLLGAQGAGWQIHSVPLDGPSATVRFRYLSARGQLADAAIDSVHFGEPPQPPEFQPNSAESGLHFDDRRLREMCFGEYTILQLDSALIGMPYELFVAPTSIMSRSAGATVTGAGQLINLPLTPGLTIPINQTQLGSPLPHPGRVEVWIYCGSYFTACAQQLVSNPASADGFSLSQAAQVRVSNMVAAPGPHPGPGGDDEAFSLNLEEAPYCSTLRVPFYGTLYDRMQVDSNGRLVFGTDASDYTASIPEALQGPPQMAFWTDLDPSSGGQVDIAVSASELVVSWTGVPYFGTPSSNDFVLAINASGDLRFRLAGVQANPTAVSFAAGDHQWLGISAGQAGAATDPGSTFFGFGLMGQSALPTDMLYDHFDDPATLQVPGLLDAITRLQASNGELHFSPLPGGMGYSFIGL